MAMRRNENQSCALYEHVEPPALSVQSNLTTPSFYDVIPPPEVTPELLWKISGVYFLGSLGIFSGSLKD